MQRIVFRFDSLEELANVLNASGGDSELSLPCREGIREGEWLLVTLCTGDDATCAPGRVADRGGELRLVFEQRDWEQLVRFADGDCRPSVPPTSQSYVPENVSAPPGATALLVDDDRTVTSIVRAMLAACGVATQIAYGAEEALDVLRRRHFDLVVIEPALNGMSGLELCRRVRAEARLACLPILVLTSQICDRDVRDAFCAGADDFLAKPFRAHELRARVLGLLHRTRTELTGRPA